MTPSRTIYLFLMAMLTLGLTACDPKKQTTPPKVDMQQDMGDVDMPPDMEEDIRPKGPMAGLSPARLLTRYEYDNTVSDLFGQRFDITSTMSFPSENLVGWFENDAWSHKVSPLLINKYIEASESITKTMIEQHKATLYTCEGMPTDEATCAKDFLEQFAPRAFRRPLSSDEWTIIENVFTSELAKEDNTLDDALSLALQSILQSPQFLYRIELKEASMSTMPPQDGGMTSDDFELVGSYEMASRLSYFLWASMPDETLLTAAKNGELSTPAQIEVQVERMLGDERAHRMVRQFHRQWLGLKSLKSLVKSGQYYPLWNNNMRSDFTISLNRFVDYVFWEEGTFDAFMTSNVLFLTDALAPLYGVEVPADSGGVFKYVAPVNERFGIMTQPALLAMLANANQSSPILRGIFMRERLLCQHIPPPPNDQEIEPPDPDPNATTREIFAIHTANDACAGCHTLIDPVGFGFENFDGVGHYRSMENNFPIDASGGLIASPDPTLNGDFANAKELSQRLAQSDVVQSCMTDQWLQFALGRNHDASDTPSLDSIKFKFKQSGYKWSAMFKAIAVSDSFRYRKKEEQEQSK